MDEWKPKVTYLIEKCREMEFKYTQTYVMNSGTCHKGQKKRLVYQDLPGNVTLIIVRFN